MLTKFVYNIIIMEALQKRQKIHEYIDALMMKK